MEIKTREERFEFIYIKFKNHVLSSRCSVSSTWERLAEFVALHMGKDAVPVKSMINRWRKGGGMDAGDALAFADICGVDFRWLITGEGEPGSKPFRSLPGEWKNGRGSSNGERLK